jgi:phage tail-like protein
MCEVTAHAAGALAFKLTLRGDVASQVVELELPAFYVDAITFTPLDAAPVRYGNLLPEPGSVARADAPISLDVFPSSTDVSTLTITVNGVTAFAAGAFAPDYAGSLSAVTTVTGAGKRIVIDPLGVWGTGEAVEVDVSSTAVGDVPLAWSFTGQRTLPPQVAQVIANDLQTVRVTFDEDVVMGTGAGAEDALNPAVWAIERTPNDVAVAVVVTAVTQVDARTVDLTADIPLSPGHSYVLILDGVHDADGNLAAGDSYLFTSFLPPAPAGRDFDLWDLIPQINRTQDQTGELERFLAMFQDCLLLLLFKLDTFGTIIDPDVAPEQYVDAMLADLGNPFSFPLTLTQKRQLVQLLVPIYKQKGTDAGIVNAVRLFLGFEVTIISDARGTAILDGITYFGEDGGPDEGTFELGSSDEGDLLGFSIDCPLILTDAQLQQVTDIANYMKRAECHVIRIIQAVAPPVFDPVELGAAGELGEDGGDPGDFILH